MRGQKRTPIERAKVVGIAIVKGVPAAAKETGVPMRSIRRYKDDPEMAQLVLSAREDVAAAMWAIIQDGLTEVHDGLRKPDERLRDKADALFGLMTQHALYTGQATIRSETRDLTNTLDDHELDLLRAAIAAQSDSEAAMARPGSNGTDPAD